MNKKRWMGLGLVAVLAGLFYVFYLDRLIYESDKTLLDFREFQGRGDIDPATIFGGSTIFFCFEFSPLSSSGLPLGLMANRFAAERGLVFQFNKDELILWGVTDYIGFLAVDADGVGKMYLSRANLTSGSIDGEGKKFAGCALPSEIRFRIRKIGNGTQSYIALIRR